MSVGADTFKVMGYFTGKSGGFHHGNYQCNDAGWAGEWCGLSKAMKPAAINGDSNLEKRQCCTMCRYFIKMVK